MLSCTTIVNVDIETSLKLVNFVSGFISSSEEKKEKLAEEMFKSVGRLEMIMEIFEKITEKKVPESETK